MLARLLQSPLSEGEVVGKSQSAAVGVHQAFVGGFKFIKINISFFKILLGKFSTILEHYLAGPFSNIRKDILLLINFFCFLRSIISPSTPCLSLRFKDKFTVFLLITFRELGRYHFYLGLIRSSHVLSEIKVLSTLSGLGEARN
jgi:hypothetical protein